MYRGNGIISFYTVQENSSSLTVKWKKSRTTRTLIRVGHLAKLRNQTSRTLIMEVTRNPTLTLTVLQKFSAEMGKPKGGISVKLHESELHSRVVRWKPSCVENSASMRTKILSLMSQNLTLWGEFQALCLVNTKHWSLITDHWSSVKDLTQNHHVWLFLLSCSTAVVLFAAVGTDHSFDLCTVFCRKHVWPFKVNARLLLISFYSYRNFWMNAWTHSRQVI